MTPVKIVLTDHVVNEVFPVRLKGCPTKEFLKVAQKAYRSTEPIGKGEITNERYHTMEVAEDYQYRKMMGYIFVFATTGEHDGVALITFYPPARKASSTTPQGRPSNQPDKAFKPK